MKKSLMMLGVAAIAFAGCTNNEVLEVAENNQAIGFGTFVENATRAVNDLNVEGKFNKFIVYGAYTGTGITGPVSVFNADEATKNQNNWTHSLQYWVTGMSYKFAAYSDGNASFNGVTFDKTTGKLKITGYVVGEKDLIMTDAVAVDNVADNYNTAVNLTFKHLLSKVNFKFTTTYDDNLTVKISDLTIADVVNKGTYDNTWTGATDTKAAKTFNGTDGVTATAAGAASEECYVLPQSPAQLKVSFTVTVTDKGDKQIAQRAFTDDDAITLALDAQTTDGTWQAGNAYTYSAKITPENVKPDSAPITFNPSVGSWAPQTPDITVPNEN